MQARIHFFRFTPICSSLVIALLCGQALAADSVPWARDLATAQQLAAQSGKLVLVHFTSDQCAPCLRLEKNVFSQPIFGHNLSQNYVPVKINATSSPELARQFNVNSWPTDIILSSDQQEVHRMISSQDATEYLQILGQVNWRFQQMQAGSGTLAQLAGTSTLKGQRPYEDGRSAEKTNLFKSLFQKTPFADRNGSSTAPGAKATQAQPGALAAKPQFGRDVNGIPYPLNANQPQAIMTSPGAFSQPYPNSPANPPYGGGSFPTAAYPPAASPGQAHPAQSPLANNNPYQTASVPNRTASIPNIYSGAAPQNTPPQTTTTNYLDENPSPATVAVSSHQQPFQPPQQAVIDNLFVKNSAAPAPPSRPKTASSAPSFPPQNTFATPPLSMPNISGETIQASSNSSPYNASGPGPVSLGPTEMPQRGMYAEASGAPADAPGSPMATQDMTQSGSGAGDFALDGYCCVTLLDENRWVLGNSRWGARHRGKVYLFQSAVAQQQFLADLTDSPVLGGYDPVILRETGRYELGARSHGVRYQDQMFLFSSEESLQRFWKAPWQYAELARQTMLSDSTTMR